MLNSTVCSQVAMSGEMSLSSSARQAKVCLIFATRGRAEVLERVVAFVASQTVQPDLIIVSCVSDEDAGKLASRPGLLVIKGQPGLTVQRNHALKHVPDDFDVVILLDDDFLMHSRWIAEVLKTLDSEPAALPDSDSTSVLFSMGGRRIATLEARSGIGAVVSCASIRHSACTWGSSVAGCPAASSAIRRSSIRSIWRERKPCLCALRSIMFCAMSRAMSCEALRQSPGSTAGGGWAAI